MPKPYKPRDEALARVRAAIAATRSCDLCHGRTRVLRLVGRLRSGGRDWQEMPCPRCQGGDEERPTA